MVWLISIPRDGDAKKKDFAWDSLRSRVSESRLAEVYRFEVPSLKVGTFDQLLGISDDLIRMDLQVESVVRKIERQLKEIQDRPTAPVVKEKPAEEYVRSFSWDQFRYPLKAPLKELVEAVQKQVATLDEELKEKVADYNQKRQQLQNVSRSATGNLLVRSLDGLIRPDLFIDTEYLISVFVIVGEHSVEAFLKEYETLNQWVVPRSAVECIREPELVCFRVVIFKKILADFKTTAREKRYTVREYAPEVDTDKESSDKQKTALKENLEKLHKSLMRWCVINFSEVFQAWIHLKTIRVFVESVLRYGLPANIEAAIIKPIKKNDKKVRNFLFENYKHLNSSGGSMAMEEGSNEAFFPYVSIDINIDGESNNDQN